MRKWCNAFIQLLVLLCLLVSGTASAHLLKVFAWMEGNQIVGNAYFAGGIAAGGANILVFNNAKQQLITASPNADGSFRVTVPYSAGYDIEANTGDGHVAHWQIPASEVTETPAADANQQPAGGAAPVNASAPAASSTTNATSNNAAATPAPQFNILANNTANDATLNVDADKLAELIQTAVAKEVGPLRMELQQADARAKLSDIIGGLGFIFGIAGIALWWRSRQS